jgi:hypothetical protein
VVRVLGYRSGGPGSIPGTTRFSEKEKKGKQVVGLERGPLSLVSTTEELLDKKSSGSCLENREYAHRDPSRWPCGTLYPQKLATTSQRSSGRSVGIVRSRTQTMEFVCFFFFCLFSILPSILFDIFQISRGEPVVLPASVSQSVYNKIHKKNQFNLCECKSSYLNWYLMNEISLTYWLWHCEVCLQSICPYSYTDLIEKPYLNMI